LRARIDAHPIFAPLLVAALSLAYFGAGLGARELTLLESQDLSVAAELLQTFRLSADHSPLHFALVNLWLRSGGASVALLRLPSAVCVALATAAVFQLGKRLGGTAVGVWSALLFAVNPEIVDQARSLRLYGFALFWCALSLERAHAFGFGERRERALVGFLVAAVLAVHTHLFLWLWVLPLAALVAARAFVVLSGAERRRALVAGAIAGLSAVPQVVHGFIALGFTHERHAVYAGVSGRLGQFLIQVGQHLLLGETEPERPLPGYVVAWFAALPVLGVTRLEPTVRRVALLALAPPFVAAFLLSFTSEVEARYFCFALPGLALLAGVGLAALPRVVGAGAALAAAVVALVVTGRAYGPPVTDWYAAAERLESLKRDGDVVAVFPGYWAETFRFYTRARDLVPITYPVDLERVLARSGRVLLVLNGGRYTGDLDAYLEAYTARRALFRTHIRDEFEVDEVLPRANVARPPERKPATIVFMGLVGGGGYEWSAAPDGGRAFAPLAALLSAADLGVAGYAPYEPPWPARCLLGSELSERLGPQVSVAKALQAAGLPIVAVSSERGALASAAEVLAAAHLGVVPYGRDGNTAKPFVYEMGTQRIAMIALGTSAAEAIAQPAGVVARVRAGLQRTDALVVFVPSPARFDALPTPDEREEARRLVDAGADVVIGNGGYAAKPVERYRGSVIAYSLGALLAPPTLDLVRREATGLALRVEFDAGRPLHVDPVPTTFDDRDVARLGRIDSAPQDVPAEFQAFVDGFRSARVWTTRAQGEPLRPLAHGRAAPSSAWDVWLDREIKSWIPWSPRSPSPRPFASGFFDGRNYAGIRGIRSIGQSRAAIEIDAAPGTALTVELPPVPLGSRLDVAYALPDDREQSKFRPLLDETLSVGVEGGPSFSDSVPFRAGWHHASLDTRTSAGTPRHITLELSSPASHFPVAIELRLEP
jgi:mannosyltransferase